MFQMHKNDIAYEKVLNTMVVVQLNVQESGHVYVEIYFQFQLTVEI